MFPALLAAAVVAGAPPVISPGPANGEQSPPAIEVPVPVAAIVFAREPVAQVAKERDLRTSLKGNLIDLEVDVAVESLAPGGNVFTYLSWARERIGARDDLAVFWLMARGPATVDLYLLPPGSELGYVRTLELPEDPVERAEALAVVVRATTQSMRDGNLGGMRVIELEPPVDEGEASDDPVGPDAGVPEDGPEEPADDTAPEPRVRTRIGAAYEGGTLSRSAAWQNGAVGHVGLRLSPGVILGVHAGWMGGPSEAPLVSLRLRRVPIGLTVGYQLLADRRVSVALEAAVRAERLGWSITKASDDAVEGRAGSYWRFGLGPQAQVVVRIVGGLSAQVTAAGLFWAVDRDLVVDTVDGRRTVLRPDVGAFRFGAGLAYEF